VKGQEVLNPLFQLQLRVFLLKQKNKSAKLLVAYEMNRTIMEADEAEALKLHI